MKLVIVIVSNKDLTNVLSSTVEEGYFSTKISTQGMFLENGQTTVLFGVKDEDVDKLFSTFCGKNSCEATNYLILLKKM